MTDGEWKAIERIAANSLQDNTPATSPMDKLKAASKTAVRTIEETPYQPIVYAIPKEDWNAFREWTKQAVTFQPTLYQQIATLTTKQESEAYTDEMWSEIQNWSREFTEQVKSSSESIVPRVNKLLYENKELLQQDGKAREKFISDLDWREQTRIDKYEELLMKTKRWIITAIASTIGGSAILSTVICLLMR